MENTNKVPKWLKKLQESSWELELLISGGAIFTLFRFSDLIKDFFITLRTSAVIPGSSLFMIIIMVGVKMLTIGFIIHLSMRAYWLALVCVSYAFPQGAAKPQIKWKKPFKIQIPDDGGMYHKIMSIDRNCGLIMYMSIISTLILIGFVILIIVLLSIPYYVFITFGDSNLIHNLGIVYNNAFVVVLLFYLFDFFSFGMLRKIPYLSWVIYLPFKLFDLLSLRFLYQHSLWMVNTNIKKSKMFLYMSVYAVIGIVFAYLSLHRVFHWPNVFDQRKYLEQIANNSDDHIVSRYYMDQLDGEKVNGVAIQSLIVKDKCLKLFSVYTKELDDLMEYIPAKNGTKKFSDLAYVKIDDSVYTHLDWMPTQNKDRDQWGMTAFIPITHLTMGKHVMIVRANLDSATYVKVSETRRMPRAVIPFWKDY